SYTGKAGAQEVIKTSLNKILKQTRVAEETGLVEELLKRMKQGKLAVYGKEDTLGAIHMGAVETLLVSQEKLNDFDEIMLEAEKVSARIVIVSADHESSEKLLGLGGIGALLRFELRK
ncbi:MAG: mRNA surveillance protein Pelota, partial [Candidatus Aenigmatarchaeota archaeon]